MAEAVLLALTNFFTFEEDHAAEEKHCATWLGELKQFPDTNLYFLTRTSPDLLEDIFIRSKLSQRQRWVALLRLSAKKVDPARYRSPQGVTQDVESLREVGLLSLTREQVGGRVAADARGDPQLSPLYTRYAAVRQTAGVAQLMAISLVCAVDEYLRREGRFTTIVGPSTIPRAGLGVIVLGRSVRNQSFPYMGALRDETELDWHNAYRMDIGGGRYIDGSVVCTRGTMANSSLGTGCNSTFEALGGQCVVRTQRHLASEEVLVDYDVLTADAGRLPAWSW